MTNEADFELTRMHIAFVRGSDGALRPAFVIDGRDYRDGATMLRDLDDAWAELSRRQLVAEFETQPVEGQERVTWLPSWSEYKSDAT